MNEARNGPPPPACNSNTAEKGSSDVQAVSPKTNAACTASWSQMSTRQPHCLNVPRSQPTKDSAHHPLKCATRTDRRAEAAMQLTCGHGRPGISRRRARNRPRHLLFLSSVPARPSRSPPSLLASSSAPVSPLYFLSPLAGSSLTPALSPGKFRGTGEPREIHSLTTLTLTASWDRSLRARRVRATVRFLSRSPRSFRHELERACGPGQATGSVGSRW